MPAPAQPTALTNASSAPDGPERGPPAEVSGSDRPVDGAPPPSLRSGVRPSTRRPTSRVAAAGASTVSPHGGPVPPPRHPCAHPFATWIRWRRQQERDTTRQGKAHGVEPGGVDAPVARVGQTCLRAQRGPNGPPEALGWLTGLPALASTGGDPTIARLSVQRGDHRLGVARPPSVVPALVAVDGLATAGVEDPSHNAYIERAWELQHASPPPGRGPDPPRAKRWPPPAG